MIELLRKLIGEPPVGFEWVEYILCAIVFLLVVKITIDVFFSIFRGVTKW